MRPTFLKVATIPSKGIAISFRQRARKTILGIGVACLQDKQEWVPDKQRTHCTRCCKRFSIVQRRHHCRLCGEVVCRKCCRRITFHSSVVLACELCIRNSYVDYTHPSQSPTHLPCTDFSTNASTLTFSTTPHPLLRETPDECTSENRSTWLLLTCLSIFMLALKVYHIE